MSINDVSLMYFSSAIMVMIFMVFYPVAYLIILGKLKNIVVYLIFIHGLLSAQLYSLHTRTGNIYVAIVFLTALILWITSILSLKISCLKRRLIETPYNVVVHVLLVEITQAISLSYYITLLF